MLSETCWVSQNLSFDSTCTFQDVISEKKIQKLTHNLTCNKNILISWNKKFQKLKIGTFLNKIFNQLIEELSV